MTHVSSVNDVAVSQEPLLNGWGRLGEIRRSTARALLVDYHGHDLWLAKANCGIWAGAYYAKTFAITAAKQWAEQNPRKS